jgi:hypothetical protein
MAYGVNWVEAAAARGEHLAVWERNLALKVGAQQRFQWFYRDNPAGPGRLAVLEERSDGGVSKGVVGTSGYGVRMVQADGAMLRAALMGDVAVDKVHRTAIPAILMTKEMRRHVLADFDVAYGFPNHLAAPLVIKLGYKKLGDTRRFALALRHHRHMASQLSSPLAARGAAVALDIARAGLVAARAAVPVVSGLRLVWSVDVDDRFDRLWERAASAYPIIGVRDAAYVRWRFLERAEGRMDLAGAITPGTGELAGYAAVEWEDHVAHLRDVFAERSALAPFLGLLCGGLMLRGATSISMRVLGAPALVGALTELGFRERDDKRTVVCGVGKSGEPRADALYDANRWYLTDADEDA